MDKIHPIDYHQERVINGIKFICYNAGHVIGAAMFLVEIEGKSLNCNYFSRSKSPLYRRL